MTLEKSEEYVDELKVVSIRLVDSPPLYSKKKLKSPEAVYQLLSDEFSNLDREIGCVLNLKTNGEVINLNIVSMGSLNASVMESREIFKSSILSNAASIILLHTHPSGELQPSKEDINLTKRIEVAGEILGISLLDHIILGQGEYMSFKKEGYMQSEWKGQQEMIQAVEKEWKERSR